MDSPVINFGQWENGSLRTYLSECSAHVYKSEWAGLRRFCDCILSLISWWQGLKREKYRKMLRTKAFLKKTKKGSILKIVREHYLRDDIWCGSQLCSTCAHDVEEAVLESEPAVKSTLCDFPHYLIPDTNVVLHQVRVRRLRSPNEGNA